MGTESCFTNLEHYLHKLRSTEFSASADTLTLFAQQAVALFFEHYEITGDCLRVAIEVLCEIASLPDPVFSRIGTEALFSQIIEILNDSFDKRACDVYDRLFAQIISFFRKLPTASSLDEMLNQFGLADEATILARKMTLSTRPQLLGLDRPLKKIFVLSRVTIGADVAITSVLISGLKQHFPTSRIILIGPAKLVELYGGDSTIEIIPVAYGRRSDVLARFQSWLEIVNVITNETSNLSSLEFCVFDPDSRYTQLGLLPVVPPPIETNCYYHFESRTFVSSGAEKLGQLTKYWLSELCGKAVLGYPFVSISPSYHPVGKAVCTYLRDTATSRVICLSFGVGGNQKKRVSYAFEALLVEYLARENKLVIDCGFTVDEIQQAERVLAHLERIGKTTLRLSEQTYQAQLPATQKSVDVISWQGGIGSFATIIESSDLYLGYDSSGQHLATAMKIPTFTIFVNSGSSTFGQRWQPHGEGKIKVFLLEPCHIPSNTNELNELVQGLFQRLQGWITT